jgi:cytoskeletal protein CcmA (bactofilin family)
MDGEKGTVIDSDARFEGTLTGKDVRVLGRFKGDIDAKGRLVLGESSQVEAKVLAEIAEIAGEFKGEVVADKLILMEKARVSGTFDAKVLSVREGAKMDGTVNAGDGRKGTGATTSTALTTSAAAKPTAGANAG